MRAFLASFSFIIAVFASGSLMADAVNHYQEGDRVRALLRGATAILLFVMSAAREMKEQKSPRSL